MENQSGRLTSSDEFRLRIGRFTWGIKYWELLSWGAVVFAAWYVFFSIEGVLFGTHDDIGSFIGAQHTSFSQFMKDTMMNTIQRVRIDPLFMLSQGLTFLAYQSGKLFFIQAIRIIPICLAVISVSLLANKRIGKPAGQLMALLFFTLAQIDHQHNLFVSYPSTFQIGIVVYVVSIELFYRYYDAGKQWYRIVSALMMFATFSYYESFVLYTVTYFFIALGKSIEHTKDKSIKIVVLATLKNLWVHIIAGAAYVAIYILIAKLAPMSYGGRDIPVDSFSLTLAIKTMLTLATGLFPLRNALALGFPHSGITEVMVFKAIFSAVTVVILVFHLRKLEVRRLVVFLLCAVFAGVLFCLPHAMTVQYQTWVSVGITAFVPSYFSYFWILAFAVALLCFFANIKWLRIPIIFLSGVIIFGSSILTDCANQITIAPLEQSSIRYVLFEELVSDDYYAALPDGSIIYTPDFIGLHHQMDSLSEYGELRSGKAVTYTRTYEEMSGYNHCYYLQCDPATRTIILGKIQRGQLCDEIRVLQLDSVSPQTLVAIQEGARNGVVINGHDVGMYNNSIIVPELATGPFTVQGNGIDIDSVQIISNNLTTTRLFEFGKQISINDSLVVELLEGWHSAENWGRWSDEGPATMEISFDTIPKDGITATITYQVVNSMGLDTQIFCGDKLLYEGILYGTEPLVFNIPAECVSEERSVCLEFIIQGAIQPGEVDPNNTDTRLLGMGISHMVFDEGNR